MLYSCTFLFTVFLVLFTVDHMMIQPEFSNSLDISQSHCSNISANHIPENIFLVNQSLPPVFVEISSNRFTSRSEHCLRASLGDLGIANHPQRFLLSETMDQFTHKNLGANARRGGGGHQEALRGIRGQIAITIRRGHLAFVTVAGNHSMLVI